ncbi:protein Shroom1 [Hemicordylus capensis]|uniref:protein Shroom1 n=1 Tax=Hemicordylus capensis TaxID=884348 RepID=UPI002303C3AB|nr:protein Shroom1 [Hemicordylus capensis]
MSSYGDEASRWNLRHVRRIAELLEPVASPSYANRFSPEKSLGGMDQCLHIPGKADSAYSSFSGGSNIPECPIPPCYNEQESLPSEQLPYMDSGYVRGIYNPSAINSDIRQLYEDKTAEMSRHNLDNTGHGMRFGSIPTHGMVCQSSTPPAIRLPPPLPHLPSPQAQVDSYQITRKVEQSHPTICFDYSVQAEHCPNPELPFDSPVSCYEDCWLSRCKTESPITEEEDLWYAANQNTTKEINSAITTKPCLTFQEYLNSGSLDKTQKILCAQHLVHTYKSPEEMNSKSSPSLHASHNAVNDTQENKQYFYACSVHKPPFTETDLPNSLAGPSTAEGQRHGALHSFETDSHSGLDQDRCESCLSLKYADSFLPNEAVLGIINSYEVKQCWFGSEGETSRDVWQPLLKQKTRMQKLPSCGLDGGDTLHCEVYDTADTVSYYKHDEDSASRALNGFRKAKQNDNHSSPDLLTNSRQEEMLKPVQFPKQPFPKKAESQSQDNPTSMKINRKTTPLLYYLSGGKNSNVVSLKNQVQEQEDFPVQSPRGHHLVSAEPIEIPRDKNNSVDDTASTNEGLILGSPASSVDEKFKNDYREKLKVAQRKVLRETSFKRKDLQMSLPIRLKQKPSSRPSIQHLRSLSLSSTNEDSIPPPKPLETITKEEESKRPLTIRIGGRKRATKEQKKISYSEPEKLNQLDDQRDQSIAWRNKNARSRSDEINEQDTRMVISKTLENQGRAVSKAELKQIQHNALLEYMERKIGQRPVTAQSSTQQKPPLQRKPSNSKKFSEDNRKLQNIDGFCQFPAPGTGRILEPPSFPSTLTPTAAATNIPVPTSSVSEMANAKVQLSVKEAAVSEGSCGSKHASTKSLLHSVASASSKGRGRLKPTPSPVQDIYRSAAFPALSTQDHENYLTHPSSPQKEEQEMGPSDKKPQDSFATVKPSTYTAGRRGKSMEETGISEVVRLSPLSQSTDQLHHLKSWHISSGLETCKNSQGTNHQNILQNCESASGHLSRQLCTEGVAGLNATVQALEQPRGIPKLKSTFVNRSSLSLCHGVPLSTDRLQPPVIPLESLHASPASPAETDNDVFQGSFASGSETVSNLPAFYRQRESSIPDRKTPEPALAAPLLRISTEEKQIREELNSSIPVPEKEECNLGSRNGNSGENSSENSHCLEIAPDLPAFYPKERSNKDSQSKKEIRKTSQVFSTSERTQRQPLEANDTTHHLENRTHNCTALMDNQGENNSSQPLANANALQNEHRNEFPVEDTDLSIAQSKSREDQRREELAIEIMAKDKSLVDILMPHPKTALDLMEGLFPMSISGSDRSCRRKGRIQENKQSSNDGSTDSSLGTENYLGQRTVDGTFHINQVLRKNKETLDDPDITSKKKELISSIQQKLQSLWNEKELIQSEAKEHSVHGQELESMVQGLCKPNEYERYMMFIGDLEKVVSLLLCLSSRLARIQNAMEKIDENTDAEEKQSLNERHRLLSRQREDAKDLKENLDRRERVVSGILSKYMTESQLQDYRHFVQAKTSLLIEQKHLDEQIKFLEEQVERLEKSILT